MSPGSGRPPVRVTMPRVTLAHGGGGTAMRDLIADVFAGPFDNPMLAPLEDQARASLAELGRHGDRLAITTDSFVVDPLFFPGGDIGRLAVCGTVNDLAVGGARPLYLSCAVIIEEGLPVDTLRRVSASMRAAADLAGVAIVTGDTKVVQKGAADQLFVTTTGIGVIPRGISIAACQLEPGDRIVVNDFLGDHGIAILAARGDLDFETDLRSDCRPLHGLVDAMLDECPEIRAMRDVTRGGLAAVLNEFAAASACAIELDERALPLRPEVRSAAELLGLDPLYLASEGALAAAVPAAASERVLAAMRAHPYGASARIIGEVHSGTRPRVVMRTAFGGSRVVDRLVGEQLPRIC
jgi:hydrogenase expression/formation protein HypE